MSTTQSEELNVYIFKQGGATIVLDFDDFARHIPFDKLIYLNGKIAERMIDVLSNMLVKEISDDA